MKTPFSYVQGPHYVYLLTAPLEGGKSEEIYVGRGRGRRARSYYQLGRAGGLPANYFTPRTHNSGLNQRIAEVRAKGWEVMVFGYDCGASLAAAQALEKKLIQKYGRRDQARGTLFNRNAGG